MKCNYNVFFILNNKENLISNYMHPLFIIQIHKLICRYIIVTCLVSDFNQFPGIFGKFFFSSNE